MPAGAAVASFRLGRVRAEAFARAWRRWLGPSALLFTHRSEAGRDALALTGSQPVDYETSARRVWV